MTKAPKPQKDENGNYVPNGARAKAGLNKGRLESAWGKVRLFTSYKARRVNKLVIGVPPHHTSQECSRCSLTHSPGQSPGVGDVRMQELRIYGKCRHKCSQRD